MIKRVLILGASRYYSKSIEATQKAGYHVIAIDKNQDSPGFKVSDQSEVCDIIDCKKVLKLSQKFKINGIIPINDYGVKTAAFVSYKMNLPGISPECAEIASSKILMRKKWQEKGLACPKFYLADSRKSFDEAINHVGFPCIFKPAFGVGGASRGVVVVRNIQDVESAIQFTQSFYDDKRTIVESYIESHKEHSAEVIIYQGQIHILAIGDKIKTPLPYRVDKNVLYPTSLSLSEQEKYTSLITEAIKALDIKTGAVHIEFGSLENDSILFEIGARCGGGGTPEPIIPYVTGVDEFVENVRILTGDKPVNLKPIFKRGCNYHFLLPKPGRVKSISGIEEIKKMEGVLDFEFFIKQGDEIPEVKSGLDRSGFIITGALNRDKAYELGQKTESLLKIEYESI